MNSQSLQFLVLGLRFRDDVCKDKTFWVATYGNCDTSNVGINKTTKTAAEISVKFYTKQKFLF